MLPDQLDLTYFRPATNSFWQWEDNVNVICGISNYTICYRDDLTPLLRELAVHGLPSLESILLCITACSEGLTASKYEESLKVVKNILAADQSQDAVWLGHYTHHAIRLMNLVRGLSPEWRTGARRVHLLIELFSNTEAKIPADRAVALVSEFSSGKWYNVFANADPEGPSPWGIENLRELKKILGPYADSKALELKLKTGLTEITTPAPIELPQTETDKSLMEQLAEDDKTAGIAQLTQHLIAALNIPMHAANASDHLFGGVSDISNRGNFDKLLISELANDDLTLTARLVNNEALYLRREAPPVSLDRKRNILMDTTIKINFTWLR